MKPINPFFTPLSQTSPSRQCRHTRLVRLPAPLCRRQCRHCGRVLPAEAPDAAFCTACFARDGIRRRDFRETNVIDVSFAHYQCEDCGAMIHAQ